MSPSKRSKGRRRRTRRSTSGPTASHVGSYGSEATTSPENPDRHDLLVRGLAKFLQAFIVGLYAAVGVFVAMGYDGFVKDPLRLVYGAATVFAFKASEYLFYLLPRPNGVGNTKPR